MSNYKFKTTNIRGKQYVEVNERIKFFRQEDRYKDWGILTEFPVIDDTQCLCLCTITTPAGQIVAQGHAHEEKGSSNINKTSYVENCETSAVGRALAMLGIGIDTSIASANESRKPLPNSKSSLTIHKFRSFPKSSTPQSRTSWTKQLHTSKVRLTRGRPSIQSPEVW